MYLQTFSMVYHLVKVCVNVFVGQTKLEIPVDKSFSNADFLRTHTYILNANPQ